MKKFLTSLVVLCVLPALADRLATEGYVNTASGSLQSAIATKTDTAAVQSLIASGTAAMITGTISHSQINGLGSAALSANSAFEAAGNVATASNALQSAINLRTTTANVQSLISTGTAATISGNIGNAQITGLGSAALASTTAFEAAGTVATASNGLQTAINLRTTTVDVQNLITSGTAANMTAAYQTPITFANGLTIGSGTASLTGYTSSAGYYLGTNTAGTWGTHVLPQTGTNTITIETYTSGTAIWTCPTGAKAVKVILMGGGGGGGSGRVGAGGTVRCGGGGGGAGGYSEYLFNPQTFTSSVAISVGSGGSGAAVQTSTDTNGNAGVAGGNSTFGSYLIARGGAKAPGGLNTSGWGGAGGTGLINGISGASSGTSGGTPTLITPNPAGNGQLTSAGGCGGSITAYNVETAAAKGGNIAIVNVSDPAAGTIPGGNGGTITDLPPIYVGVGGGGGACSSVGNGGAGGDAAGYGSGGGGGGAVINGSSSGAGGSGRSGFVIIVTYF